MGQHHPITHPPPLRPQGDILPWSSSLTYHAHVSYALTQTSLSFPPCPRVATISCPLPLDTPLFDLHQPLIPLSISHPALFPMCHRSMCLVLSLPTLCKLPQPTKSVISVRPARCASQVQPPWLLPLPPPVLAPLPLSYPLSRPTLTGSNGSLSLHPLHAK